MMKRTLAKARGLFPFAIACETTRPWMPTILKGAKPRSERSEHISYNTLSRRGVKARPLVGRSLNSPWETSKGSAEPSLHQHRIDV